MLRFALASSTLPLLGAGLLAAAPVLADPRPGDLDLTWNSASQPGWIDDLTEEASGYAPGDVAVDSLGRVVVVTFEHHAGLDRAPRIRRLLPNGLPDPTFGSGGSVDLWGPNYLPDAVVRLALDDADNIYLASTILDAGDPGAGMMVVRFGPTGSILGANVVHFDLGGVNSDRLTALAVGGGRVVLVGTVGRPDFADTDFGTAVFHSNSLSLDTTFDLDGRRVVHFDVGGELADIPWAVAFDGLGGILVAGQAATSSGSMGALVHLSATGAVVFKESYAFTPVLGLPAARNRFDDVAVTHSLQGSAIWLAGSTEDPRFIASRPDLALIKLSFAGTPAAGWGTMGSGWRLVSFFPGGHDGADYATALELDSRGRFVMIGSAIVSETEAYLALARLDAGGNLDPTFLPATGGAGVFSRGINPYFVPTAAALQADDRLVVLGEAGTFVATTDRAWLARFWGDVELQEDGFESGDLSAWTN